LTTSTLVGDIAYEPSVHIGRPSRLL
jgi:hypothetical protein